MSIHTCLVIAFVIYSFISPASGGTQPVSLAMQWQVETRETRGMPLRIDSAEVTTVDGKSTLKCRVTNVSDQQIVTASVWLILVAKGNASIWSIGLDRNNLDPGEDSEASMEDERLSAAERLILFVSRAETNDTEWALDPGDAELLEKASHDYVAGNSYTIPDLKCKMTTKPPVPAPVTEIAAPGTVDAKPQLLEKPMPLYTEEARKRGIQGTIRARVLIGADGMPRKVTIISGLPYGLNEEAISAAYKMRFRPAMKGGQPVAYWVGVEIEFILRRRTDPPKEK